MFNFATFIHEFGLAGGLAASISIMFFFLLKWMLGQSSEMIKQMHEERLKFLDTLDRHKTAIDEHAARSREFQIRVAEEHGHILRNQERISLSHEKICCCLLEVEKGLGRINGYVKHE